MDPFAAHQQQQDKFKSPNYYNPAANSSEVVFDIKSPEFSSDHFRMYDFKVKACPRTRAHDWTQCPFSHPGEKARRRDPRKYNYSAVPCPDYRKGTCKRGDSCEYAHGVFECWLHPTRYKTQMCTDASACNRLVCFFAHHPGELRQPTDMGAMGSQQQLLQGKDMKDQLFSVALAHLLALQNQQQQPPLCQPIPAPGSPAQTVPGLAPNLGAHSPQMNALLQQMQEIQQQILTSQHMAAATVPANGMQQQQQMAAYPPQMVKQGVQYEDAMSQHQYVNNQTHSTPQKVEGSVPYYPLSPSSPIDLYFPQDDSPVASPESSEISRMASSLQELSFQAYSPQSQSPSRSLLKEGEHSEDRANHSKVGKCGSMENLLSSLPRSLSDVGLADKGMSLISQT